LKSKINTRMSPRLKLYLDNFDNLTDQKIYEISQGATFFTIDSCTTVIGFLVGRDPSFHSVVRAALLGGDTDSNASMIGGILGGMKGVEIMPLTYIEQLHRPKMVIQSALEFYKSLVKM